MTPANRSNLSADDSRQGTENSPKQNTAYNSPYQPREAKSVIYRRSSANATQGQIDGIHGTVPAADRITGTGAKEIYQISKLTIYNLPFWLYNQGTNKDTGGTSQGTAVRENGAEQQTDYRRSNT